MARTRTSGGDATGRKRQQLQKEHAEELEKRGDEISLAQAEEAERVQQGVFDPVTGVQLAAGERTHDEQADDYRATAGAALAPGTRQVGDPSVETNDDGVMYLDADEEIAVQTNDTPVLGVGMESPSQVLGGAPDDELVRGIVDNNSPTARRAGVGANGVEDLGVQTAESATKVIRVNTTLEQVTIGVGTEYNFDEGKQYRVPAHVADHLEEKGYIWH